MFSKNGGDTIQWLANPKMKLGGRKMSHQDIKALNLAYCNGKSWKNVDDISFLE